MTNPARRRRAPYLTLVVAGAAAVALGLSGCGTTTTTTQTDKAKPGSASSASSSAAAVPSAKVLYEQMRKNVTAANSVRIKGVINTGGKKLTIDIAGDRAGKNTRLLVNDGTGQVELLTVGGSTYIKADKSYWTKNASAAAAKVAAGKYVKVPASTGVGDLKVGSLLDGAFKDLPLAGALQKVEATEVDGTPAYLLADRLHPQEGRMYVSADGKATLLRLVSTKANAGSLDFSEWDAVPPMSPPPADQQVKIPGLG